jgi:hypothetical protein
VQEIGTNPWLMFAQAHRRQIKTASTFSHLPVIASKSPSTVSTCGVFPYARRCKKQKKLTAVPKNHLIALMSSYTRRS